jgi:hypothetical protein
MELKLPDHARRLADAIIMLARNMVNADDKTKALFASMINELNLLFSPSNHPFFENQKFSEMFQSWKSMYLQRKEMLPEQQKIHVHILARVANNDVDKAIAILENAIRYSFLDLAKSAEKMQANVSKPANNTPQQPKISLIKASDICPNPHEILSSHKYSISGTTIRCEPVPVERAIMLRSQLTGFKVTFTQNI